MPQQHGAAGTPCLGCTCPHRCPSGLCQGKGPGRAELGGRGGWHGVYYPGRWQNAVLLLLRSSLFVLFNELPLCPIQTLHPLCPTPTKNWAARGLAQDFGCSSSTPTSCGPEHRLSSPGPVLPKARRAQ